MEGGRQTRPWVDVMQGCILVGGTLVIAYVGARFTGPRFMALAMIFVSVPDLVSALGAQRNGEPRPRQGRDFPSIVLLLEAAGLLVWGTLASQDSGGAFTAALGLVVALGATFGAALLAFTVGLSRGQRAPS